MVGLVRLKIMANPKTLIYQDRRWVILMQELQ